MYTIAFDTTAASCSVALMKDDKLLDSFVEEMDFGQAEVLIPAIRDLLAKHNLEVRDLGINGCLRRAGVFHRCPFQHFCRPRLWLGLPANGCRRRFVF